MTRPAVTSGEERPTKSPRPIAREMFVLNPLSYSVDGAAAAIGVSRTTVWRLIESKELTTFKLGARTLIKASVLQAFIERLAAAA